MISAATESNLVLFAYDGRHRCVKRVEIQNGLGRTTIMIWGHEPSQGWGLLEERGPNGELLARHVHGPSVDDLVLSELSGVVYYYHHDHLSSTIAVTDESGNVVEQYRYDVYGQPYFYGPDGAPRSESALGLRFLFTGREWLSPISLYDYRHRAYSPSLGHFLQMDPLGFVAGDVNLYRYSRNFSVILADPLGLDNLRGQGQNISARVSVQDPTPWQPARTAPLDSPRTAWLARRPIDYPGGALLARMGIYHQFIITPDGDYGLSDLGGGTTWDPENVTEYLKDLNVCQFTSVSRHKDDRYKPDCEVNMIDYIDYDRLTNNIRVGPTGLRWYQMNCNRWTESVIANSYPR